VVRRVRRLSLSLAAVLAGATLAVVLPSSAPGDGTPPPSTASFTAEDFSWHVTGDRSTSDATIAVGGTVTFGYPSGARRHNADFSSGPAPTSCEQTAGTPGGTPPPLPTVPTAPGWSGDCRFDTPGVYSFHCDLHPLQMHGTITVVDPSAPPPTTGTTTTTTTTTLPGGGPGTTTGTTPPPGGGSPPPLRPRAIVARTQVGSALHGAVALPAAGWRVSVTAFASGPALGLRGSHAARRVRVGSIRLRAHRAGRARFALTLDAAARGALRRHGRLAITLRVVATPPGSGRAVTKTIAVALRAPRRT
jgi:plastocyanin